MNVTNPMNYNTTFSNKNDASDSMQIPYQELLHPIKTKTVVKLSRREKVSGLKVRQKNKNTRGKD